MSDINIVQYDDLNNNLQPQNIETVKRSLLWLNYVNQLRLFEDSIKNTTTATFLIHGQPYEGQAWLSHKLIKKNPYQLNSFKKNIYKTRANRNGEFLISCEDIATEIGAYPAWTDIKEEFYQIWKNQQSIILKLELNYIQSDKIYSINTRSLSEFMKYLCKPLVMEITQGACNKHRVILFLIDYANSHESNTNF
ncbi:hypothetical protein H6G06_05105 [Anabaena sphaerica FACHB-251]|uniref:Inactive STAND domain-containing protein n=1 Tax=Anabaena sphaerica FACHB-251 TaxID=2692883 RepID=A0A926WE29_9NOST|nr:hypothetical protein [Anabaena sphaerica]MBD2292875.1 hypothetical protein [Anabaena sphaerica FACHB-251]